MRQFDCTLCHGPFPLSWGSGNLKLIQYVQNLPEQKELFVSSLGIIMKNNRQETLKTRL